MPSHVYGSGEAAFTIARLPALIASGSPGEAVVAAPISPRSSPGVSLAYQPPDSPGDSCVPTPKSPQVILTLYVRIRYMMSEFGQHSSVFSPFQYSETETPRTGESRGLNGRSRTVRGQQPRTPGGS